MRRAASCFAALLWVFAAGCGGSGEPEPAADPDSGAG